jgi:tRNA (Thr-GGU) A37 N-methylase
VAVDIALAVEIPTQALRGRSLALGCGPIEAIDGTPVVDIKPVLVDWADT